MAEPFRFSEGANTTISATVHDDDHHKTKGIFPNRIEKIMIVDLDHDLMWCHPETTMWCILQKEGAAKNNNNIS
jgi:hypothetical protein